MHSDLIITAIPGIQLAREYFLHHGNVKGPCSYELSYLGIQGIYIE